MRKELKRRKTKDGWPQEGKEERIQEHEKKGWMTQSGRRGKNARSGKERTDDPKWEKRKECNGRYGNDE